MLRIQWPVVILLLQVEPEPTRKALLGLKQEEKMIPETGRSGRNSKKKGNGLRYSWSSRDRQ
jgi:hypothetical protein